MFNNGLHISEWVASLDIHKPFYLAIVDKEGLLSFTNSRFYTEFLSDHGRPSGAATCRPRWPRCALPPPPSRVARWRSGSMAAGDPDDRGAAASREGLEDARAQLAADWQWPVDVSHTRPAVHRPLLPQPGTHRPAEQMLVGASGHSASLLQAMAGGQYQVRVPSRSLR